MRYWIFALLSFVIESGLAQEKAAYHFLKNMEGHWKFQLYPGDTTIKKPTRTGTAVYRFVHDSLTLDYRIEMNEAKVITSGLTGLDITSKRFFDISIRNSRAKAPVVSYGSLDKTGTKLIYPDDESITDKSIIELRGPDQFILYPINLLTKKVIFRMVFTRQ